MDKQVLVTGASGFIALQIIHDLLERGYRVRGTLRSLEKAEHVRDVLRQHTPLADMLECVEADLNADRGWDEAVRGCDYVMHVASPAPAVQPKDPNELIIPARDGTLRVLRAAKTAGVSRVVMTSSSSAIGRAKSDTKEVTLTEQDWSDGDDTRNSPYARSKTIAEQAAWAFVNSPDGAGLELIAINPVMVQGPALGSDISGSFEVVRQLLSGSVPRIPNLSFSIVDIRTVSLAHIQAMETPEAAGKRFIVADKTMWLSEIADLLRPQFPEYARKIPRGALPDWAFHLLALFNPALRTVANDLGYFRTYSNEQLKSVLGIEPRPANDALIASARSLIDLKVV